MFAEILHEVSPYLCRQTIDFPFRTINAFSSVRISCNHPNFTQKLQNFHKLHLSSTSWKIHLGSSTSEMCFIRKQSHSRLHFMINCSLAYMKCVPFSISMWRYSISGSPFFAWQWKHAGNLLFPMLCLPVIKNTISRIHDINNAWNLHFFFFVAPPRGRNEILFLVDEPGAKGNEMKRKSFRSNVLHGQQSLLESWVCVLSKFFIKGVFCVSSGGYRGLQKPTEGNRGLQNTIEGYRRILKATEG
jgi:hypothetical protein